MFADSKFGKIKTFTFLPFNLENGNSLANISGFSAKSACNSPSTLAFG